ncbi:MAG TPA: hypothetical protein VF377_05410, partial [Acidimicrobiia bacterium]
MIEMLLVAAGVLAGADWRLLALLGGAVWFPVPTAAAVAAVLVAHRSRLPDPLAVETEVVEAVIGELRAGSSLRSSLLAAFRNRDGAA